MYRVLRQTIDINRILRLINNYEKSHNKKPLLVMNIKTLNEIVRYFSRSCTDTLPDKVKMAENIFKCEMSVEIIGNIKYGEIELL